LQGTGSIIPDNFEKHKTTPDEIAEMKAKMRAAKQGAEEQADDGMVKLSRSRPIQHMMIAPWPVNFCLEDLQCPRTRSRARSIDLDRPGRFLTVVCIVPYLATISRLYFS
jgi:hypothetical protein